MMKKVVLSAFAMSLIVLIGNLSAQTEAIDDFLGLETEILPDLKGEQRFTPPELHEKEDLKVSPEKVEIDQQGPFKGQGHSMIPWSTLDPEEFLSIDTWLQERRVKDEVPNWKFRLRHNENKEVFAKVLQCVGECSVYRGTEKVGVQHLSRILEEDEFRTEKNSVAWIYLADGSLVRLAPETSVSFLEINLSKNEIFGLARLNQGHVFYHKRNPSDLPVDDGPETDSMSLPLLVREANQQFFERMIYQKQSSRERLDEVMQFEETAVNDQFKELNKLKAENNSVTPVPMLFMLVAPNATIVTNTASFDFIHLPGGKSYFKKRTESESELSLYLRGYSAFQVNKIPDNSWYEVEVTGRNYSGITDVPGSLQIIELMTKRIKTIELAREIWMKKFTVKVIKGMRNLSPEDIARYLGFTLWDEKLYKRFEFLIEYTRRVETTHLRSMENLLTKLDGNGEKVRRELSEDLYQASLNHYLLGLKSRYDKKKMRVREMNDLQYYVWILKHGKF